MRCDNSYQVREHSLIKPYNDDRWDFTGSTIISSTAVRLTSDYQGQRGAIWNNIPCRLRNWEMHVHFKVDGKGSELFGDGFAIWYTKEKMEMGPVFGNRDKFTGLAIFFDTYANQNGAHNHGHPYVSAMINNGTLSYDHDRDGTHTELSGCESNFRKSRFETFAAIRYEKNKLTVSLDISGRNEWKLCFTTSNVHLPTEYFFGATAATGDLSDNHEIMSIKVFDISEGKVVTEDDADYSNVVPNAEYFAPPRDHVDDPKLSTLSRLTGWKLVGVFVLAAVGIIVCLMIGYILFNKTQQTSRKRLY
ncbi:hypothetical protein HELRODRAFT_65456 [Helobdella robusta]|uniref:L-type lectin-like domain-containing protein n=1 Tax=Helobdella robusta TaxID=6412 RepID=T1FY79_HELRO|nr:hypothetical protein HELRODRAFT_65456 [Helobdella robusta]ESO01944.1 hypothetical protein HELRODRAFT_65456 [Helobdella robusta]